MVGIHFPTESELSTSSQVLKDTQSYDMLVTCAHCNTPLPLSALQKHEVRSDALTSTSYMLEPRAIPTELLLIPQQPGVVYFGFHSYLNIGTPIL